MNTKHSFKSILAAGWTNFKRNSYLSIGVTGIMALVLMLLLGFISMQFLTSQLVTGLEDKLDVSVYFKTDATDEQVLSVKSDLEKLTEVAQVAYISRDQVLEGFRKDHADDATTLQALDQLDGNPFGATLNIKAQDPQKYSAITTFVEHSKYREQMRDIQNNQEVIGRINSITGAARTWGLVIALIVAIIAVLITFNTIRITIYNQKQEIEIMRLVGASNWHIRGPYLAEGGFYGIIAGVVALAIFYPIVFLISDNIGQLMSGVSLSRYFVHNSFQIVLIVLFVGVLLGMVSSIIAIRKHLKI